jgi:hypothetical protein
MGRRSQRSSQEDREVTGVRVLPLADDPGSILLRRARRLAADGDLRKAALALRERCAIVGDAASWVLAGAMWARAGRRDDAVAALREGMWLHQRAGSTPRARVVAELITRIDPSATGLDRLRRAS